MNTNTCYTLICLLAALFLAGCAAEPTMTESHFGESVRQIISAQTYDQSTLSAPSDAAIEDTDGQMLDSALEGYRGTAANPADVGRPITINVGNGQ